MDNVNEQHYQMGCACDRGLFHIGLAVNSCIGTIDRPTDK
jgi:hypothetical protein